MIATNFTVGERVPFAKYLEMPGVNASSLKHMLVSPLAYQHAQQQPRVDTDTLRAGRAGHTAILEIERFLAEYAQWETEREDGTKRIRRGGEWDAFQEANAGKTILTPAQFKVATTLRDVVRDHPVAGPLVKGLGRNELTLAWTHKRTGLQCKGRVDRITRTALIDIKTTRDCSPQAFANTAARLNYAMQLAWYSDGAEACGLGALPVKILAVQNCEPHDVVVFDLEQDVLDVGSEQYERAIDLIVECRKNQAWPGQAVDGSLPLRLPVWATSGDAELTFGGDSIFGGES